MPERYERLLRMICLVLGGVLLVRVGWVVVHHNPLAHLKIPAVPTLAAADSISGGKGTNSVGNPETAKKSTNAPSGGKPGNSTNSVESQQATKRGTNAAAESVSEKRRTNAAASAEIAKGGNTVIGTNAVALTNLVAAGEPKTSSTNFTALVARGGTNAVAGPASKAAGTGSPPATATAMLNPPQRPGMPGKARDLPPEIQARVDRITDSEILGPVMRPLPMALLGIAGNVAFLRAANGQTGLVKEGDDLGGLKLLRIGVNRVLVEQEGQKKELMIFSGFGGESLLPNESKSPP
jgi:hypothetical protein